MCAANEPLTLPRIRNVKKLYPVTSHFGVEEVVSENYPGTTEATSCPDGCNAEHHKQCLMRDGLTPECLCLPGYEQKDGGICQA